MAATTPALIYDDPRPIESLTGQVGCWSTSYGQTITAYREHGQCDWVPYYAVSRDGEIIARVPANMVVVHYQTEPSF